MCVCVHACVGARVHAHAIFVFSSRRGSVKTEDRSRHSSRALQGQSFSLSVKTKVPTMAYKAHHDLPTPFLLSPIYPVLMPTR